MSHKLISIVFVYLVACTSALDDRALVKPPGKLSLASDTVEDRIINGFTPGRFDNPHVVLLAISNSQGGQSCTGSLIHPNWVVTAAHCTRGATSITVYLGLYSRLETATQVITVPSNSIFGHPNFISNSSAIINDIALLRLNPAANIIQFTLIRTIPYACTSAGTFAGRIGRVCGWGITSDNAPQITTVIQCLDMPIITNAECQQTWGGFVNPSNVCTRVVNLRTVCHGDSGGPLTATSGILQRQKLIGALSFNGNPCATTPPDAFSRLAFYELWIRNISGVGCDPF